jgi:hypothetical protein
MQHTEVAYDWIVVIHFQRVRNEEIGRLFHRPSVRSGKGLCSMALMIKRCFRTGLVFQADGIRYMNMLKKKKKNPPLPCSRLSKEMHNGMYAEWTSGRKNLWSFVLYLGGRPAFLRTHEQNDCVSDISGHVSGAATRY